MAPRSIMLALLLLGISLTAPAQAGGAEALTPPAPAAQTPSSPATMRQDVAPAVTDETPTETSPEGASPSPVPPPPAPTTSQSPDPSYIYPAPPPAYAPGTAPPPVAPTLPAQASAEAWTLELRAIDARLTQLQELRRQHSIGGPITALAGGFGGTILSMLIVATAVEEIDRQRAFGESIRQPRNVAIAFGAVALVSAGVGVAGVLWLRTRQRVRKANDPEIRELRTRREEIRQQLRYQVYYAPQGPQASLTLAF
jgi:hypothetical protein